MIEHSNEIKTAKPSEDRQREILWNVLDEFVTLCNGKDAVLSKILGVDNSTVSVWRSKKRVSGNLDPQRSVIQLIRHVGSVSRSLNSMFSDPINISGWLTNEHPELGGVPLELMQRVEGLVLVRGYLDYVRGRGA